MRKRPRSRSTRPVPAPAPTVVGIGASAGGLEALTRFFRELPPDLGFAYVVIVHLSPQHKSNLADILQRGIEMRVAAAEDGAAVEPDHVYVIPPNVEMTLSQGRLALRPRETAPARVMPVDRFLGSLAAEGQARPIAVILSGSGRDGTEGIKAVKAAGGLVFVQSSASSGQRGMPESAGQTGMADFTLPPEKIASELVRLARHPYISTKSRAPHPALRDKPSLRRIFDVVHERTGIDFTLYKPSTVGRRLMRRLAVHRLESLDQYAALIAKEPKEAEALAEEALIHVTRFFREPEAFEALTRRALPRILKGGAGDAPIRVWAPGCSTGEEAYSLAIALLDALGDRANERKLQLFATDVSAAALEKARAARYPESIRDDVPARLLRRYFTRTDGGYQVAKPVRDACVFAKQDLTKDPPFANLDLISCRNVLIYLESAQQRRILPLFHYALKPSGALLLGAAETVGEFRSLFQPANGATRLYFKRADAPRQRVEFGPRAPSRKAAPPEGTGSRAADRGTRSGLQDSAERLLLSRFAPPGVIVNAELDILYFRGEVQQFLKPAAGKASLNLLKMLPEAWRPELHALLLRARRGRAPARHAMPAQGRSGTAVSVEVVPLRDGDAAERSFLVLFEQEKPPKAGLGASRRGTGTGSVEKLRRELAATKEYLQATVEEHEAANEELKAANEEIISSNEELQSTNEELETAKEELQAANEELSTLNEELQSRNNDLNVLNNDLVNLLASVHLPIVMLGSDLRVRRFTPMAEKVMNLIPSDVGRPIGDLRPKLELPDLEALVSEVVESVNTRELEVRDLDGRWYSLRVRPYRTVDNKIDGAVLVLVDIDLVKKASLALREHMLFAETVLDMVAEGVTVLDRELRVRSVNPAFARILELSSSPVGRPLLELSGRRLDSPELRRALAELVERGQAFSGLELEAGGARLRLGGRRLLEEGQPLSVLLTLSPSA